MKYHRLTEDLKRESVYWLSAANIDDKITTSLFDNPASTGIISTKSELWRWHTFTSDFKRTMSKYYTDQFDLTSLQGRLDFRAHSATVKRFYISVTFLQQIYFAV